MERITMKQLENKVARLNRVCGTPEAPWTRTENGEMRANIGNYHLDGAYGGYQLAQMCSETGGITNPFRSGFVSKRELAGLIDAFVVGVESRQSTKA